MLVLLVGEFMNYAVKVGRDAIIYIPSFHKDLFRHSKVKGDTHTGGRAHTHTHTHTEQGDLLSLLLFFQNNESRLQIDNEHLYS
jgi:hypothetical protein